MNASSHQSERHFIKSAAGLAAASASFDFASPLLAVDPPKWLVGCRDLHLKVAGKPDSWSCMKTLGAECAEVLVDINLSCENLFHPTRKYSVANAEDTQRLKEDLEANGCRISAFMMSNRFDERLKQELAATRLLVKSAEALGVPAIRIDVVPRKLASDPDAFFALAVKACQGMCALAEGTPIRFGVENHSTTTNDPKFLARLFDAVGSSKLGLTLDCANFYWWGHPLDELYGIYEQVAPRVVHTHCKSIHYPDDKKNVKRPMGWEYAKYNCPIYEGDIDFKRLTTILRKAGYRGDLCVEDESLGKVPEPQRAEVMRKEIAMLKKLA